MAFGGPWQRKGVDSLTFQRPAPCKAALAHSPAPRLSQASLGSSLGCLWKDRPSGWSIPRTSKWNGQCLTAPSSERFRSKHFMSLAWVNRGPINALGFHLSYCWCRLPQPEAMEREPRGHWRKASQDWKGHVTRTLRHPPVSTAPFIASGQRLGRIGQVTH